MVCKKRDLIAVLLVRFSVSKGLNEIHKDSWIQSRSKTDIYEASLFHRSHTYDRDRSWNFEPVA